MAKSSPAFDTNRFITAAQVGGIESHLINDGPGRGVRALWVNSGAGLRYRILVDRGLDIEQAFHNAHSLTFLSHQGVTPPTRALERGLDWLKGFAVGLLTSCGPTHMGAPNTDQGEELGLHGPHSHTPATIESIIQPDPHAGRNEMSVTGVLRYGSFYGPCIELRRTITTPLGENVIHLRDDFYNAGNTAVPHQWLLHVNFGYPLLDDGAEFCYDATKVEPLSGHAPSIAHFSKPGHNRAKSPTADHAGPNSFVGYLFPKPARDKRATVAIVNSKLRLAVAINYDTRQFPRCANWQHYGQREYVAALEPSTGTVEGRSRDRQLGILQFLKPGERKMYDYSLAVVTDVAELEKLRKLNRQK